MMKIKSTIAIGMVLFLTAFMFSGCAARSTELLAEDYRAMNDEQLLEYFYRLNDEIEKQEKSSGPTFGVGIGSFGRGVGGGVGLNTGETGYTADDLRKRRIEIRMELNRKNITP
jgi:hypothetical protein